MPYFDQTDHATVATTIPLTGTSIHRRIAHMLGNFGFSSASLAPQALSSVDTLTWPEKRFSGSEEAHPIDLDSMQLVELALHIEAEFDIDFRDDLIPLAPTLGDFVDMVEAALRQKAVDSYKGVAS